MLNWVTHETQMIELVVHLKKLGGGAALELVLRAVVRTTREPGDIATFQRHNVMTLLHLGCILPHNRASVKQLVAVWPCLWQEIYIFSL